MHVRRPREETQPGKTLQYMHSTKTHVRNTQVSREDKPIKMPASLNTLLEKNAERPTYIKMGSV